MQKHLSTIALALFISLFPLGMRVQGAETSLAVAQQGLQLVEPTLETTGDRGYTLTSTVTNTDWNASDELFPVIEFVHPQTSPEMPTEQFFVTTDSGFILGSGETKSLSLPVVAPHMVSGKVFVGIALYDNLGNEIIKRYAPEIIIPEKTLSPSLSDCNLSGASLAAGYVLTADQTAPPVFGCWIVNPSGQKQNIAIVAEIYQYGANGKKIAESRFSQELSGIAREFVTLDFPATAIGMPGAHTGVLSLVNESDRALTSKPEYFQLDIPGASAELSRLRLDATNYMNGDTATLSYFAVVHPLAGYPARTFGVRAFLTDAKDRPCSEVTARVPYEIAYDQDPTITIPVNTNCEFTKATLQISDNYDQVVAQKTAVTMSKKMAIEVASAEKAAVSRSNLLMGIVIITLIIVLAGVGFWWYKKRARSKSMLNIPPTDTPLSQ